MGIILSLLHVVAIVERNLPGGDARLPVRWTCPGSTISAPSERGTSPADARLSGRHGKNGGGADGCAGPSTATSSTIFVRSAGGSRCLRRFAGGAFPDDRRPIPRSSKTSDALRPAKSFYSFRRPGGLALFRRWGPSGRDELFVGAQERPGRLGPLDGDAGGECLFLSSSGLASIALSWRLKGSRRIWPLPCFQGSRRWRNPFVRRSGDGDPRLMAQSRVRLASRCWPHGSSPLSTQEGDRKVPEGRQPPPARRVADLVSRRRGSSPWSATVDAAAHPALPYNIFRRYARAGGVDRRWRLLPTPGREGKPPGGHYKALHGAGEMTTRPARPGYDKGRCAEIVLHA